MLKTEKNNHFRECSYREWKERKEHGQRLLQVVFPSPDLTLNLKSLVLFLNLGSVKHPESFSDIYLSLFKFSFISFPSLQLRLLFPSLAMKGGLMTWETDSWNTRRRQPKAELLGDYSRFSSVPFKMHIHLEPVDVTLFGKVFAGVS